MRLVFPAPLRPINATRWPRSIANEASVTSRLPATSTHTPSDSSTRRPLRAGGGKSKRSARCSLGFSTRSIRAIAFSLLCAWRDLVP